MKLWAVITIAMVELGFFSPSHLHGLSVDLSAISTSQTRSVFASGKHIHQFRDSRSRVEVAGKYAQTAGKDATYSSGIGSTHIGPAGMTVESDFRYYQSHKTIAGSAGFGYRIVTSGLGSRTEFPNEGARQMLFRAISTIRGKKKVQGRELSVVLKGEALRGANIRRADYWVDLRYRIGKHLNVGVRLEEVRDEKIQAAVLGIHF